MSARSEASAYPHVPVDEILRRIKHDDAGHARKQVTILGAGIAGLVAAYELQQLGHEVVIFEGSERLGGRILTHHFPDGSYNELGAMRVPSAHDYTHHYIATAGLDAKLIPFVNTMNQNFLDLHGQVVRVPDGRAKIYPDYGLSATPPSPPDVYPQENGGAIFGWLQANVIATLTPHEQDSLFKGEVTTDRLRYLDSLSLGAFLDATVPPTVKQLIGAYTSLAVWFDKALTMFIRDTIVGTGTGLQTLRDGMSQLPESMAARLKPDTIALGHEVTGIRLQSDAGVAIDMATPTGPLTRHADYVLCTLPFGVMRRLQLEGLSYGKLLSISQMSYAASTKVMLHCQTRFWESRYQIYGGASISDGIQRQTYYPMDHIEFAAPRAAMAAPVGLHSGVNRPEDVSPKASADPARPGALLGAYCWGSDALRLGHMTPNARADIVRRGVARFHPEILDDKICTGHASICWSSNKWSAGAFAFLLPGQLGTIFEDGRKSEGRLFFAGEHCSLDQAWIQGSLIASLAAVDEIVKI